MTNDRSYAQFNTLTITGRVSFAELVTNDGNEFLAVTLLSELKDDADAIAVTFNSTNGIMSMYKSGWLNSGRRVTVVGHLASFTELYFDKVSGKSKRLRRPKLHLTQAQVLPGGYGPGKKADAETVDREIEIDDTPQLDKKTKQEILAVTPAGAPVDDF